MRFTKKSDYALRLMETLGKAETERLIPIKSICESTNMTVKFMQSIVTDLVKSELVLTKSGPKGGIRLNRDPSQINVLEIIEAVEGPINLMDCLEHPTQCGEYKSCSIITVMYSAQKAFVDNLKTWTLKLMIGAQSDPFKRVPAQHYQYPVQNCPAIK